MEKIKLIGFDLDGTLIDSLSGSYNIDCNIISKMGNVAPSIEEYKTALSKCGTNWEQLYDRFGIKDYQTAVGMYYDCLHDFEVKAIPGAKETLERITCMNNKPIFLCSINSKKERVVKRLESTGLIKYFNEEAIFVETENKTDAIINACAEAGVSPKNALFVGDTNIDIQDANAAGVSSVAISNKYSFHPKNCLEKQNPNYILDNIMEVWNLMGHAWI